MVFTHDTEVSLANVVALVNSAEGHGDSMVEDLTSVARLNAFMDEWRWTGRRPSSQADLEAVRALRPRLERLWSSEVPDLVKEINALLVEGNALPQLVEHGEEFGWHIHATSPDASPAERMSVEAAMALIDVVRAGETGRLVTCAAEDCDDIVLDLSKNRSRRYCEGACANRAHVAAYRARQRRERKVKVTGT